MTLQAVIFDLDGLLIDSEPIWRQVELRVFASFGIELQAHQCAQTKGLRIDEVVRHWDRLYPNRIGDLKFACDVIIAGVEAELLRDARPKEGAIVIVEEALAQVSKVAIASSSPIRLIDAALHRLRLDKHITVRCSAETEEHGKPHPAVYLTAARKLDVAPTVCLAFEDSLNGVKSAKAAGMKCIAVPEEDGSAESFAAADRVLRSLTQMKQAYWQI